MDYKLPEPEKKKEHLQKNFSLIAPHYDVFNDISTFMLHRFWKRKMVSYIKKYYRVAENTENFLFLDLACGTGDFAFLMARKLSGKIVAFDYSPGMLEVAKKRKEDFVKKTGINNNKISFHQADVSSLTEINNNSVSAITMGFGLRNVNSIPAVLREVQRVLKKNGIFLHIDLGKIRNPLIRKFADFYFYKIVPFMGKIIDKQGRDFYAYLPNSNKTYLSPEELSIAMQESGLEVLKLKKYLFGQVALHIAKKI